MIGRSKLGQLPEHGLADWLIVLIAFGAAYVLCRDLAKGGRR